MKLSYMAINRTLEEGMAEDASLRAANMRHGMPVLSEGRELSDSQLVEKLASWGISIDRASFEQKSRPFLSAQEMSDALAKTCNTRFRQESHGEDWLWIALCCLWERWLPERPSFEMIDDQMQAGYDAALDGNEAGACLTWLAAWRRILRIIDEQRMAGIAEFDDRFAGTQCVFNWLSDFEMALGNAGRDKPEFLHERIGFCRTFVERFPDFDDLMIENFKRSLADSLRRVGNSADADVLYSEWLRGDPEWGWGWIGWSDGHYLFASEGQADPDRAVDLLQEGLKVPKVRDRRGILERLADVCSALGRTEEARTADSELRELDKRLAARPQEFHRHRLGDTFSADFAETWPLGTDTDEYEEDHLPSGGGGVRRVGRNEPCPCGSGKKYKKCCIPRTR